MKAEEKASEFYNSSGWSVDDLGNTFDANKWEDLRLCSQKYLSDCRKRLGTHLERSGNLFLDFGSGPIQYPEYLDYSENYHERHCIDLSKSALQIAEGRANNIRVMHGSFLSLEIPQNSYDCCIAQHVLYHIDKSEQATVVRKLLDITKPGGTIAIVYGNPNSPLEAPYRLYRIFKRLFKIETHHELYHFAFSLKWWRQFEDSADIKIHIWRTLNAFYLRRLIPNNRIGILILDILFKIEGIIPNRILTFLGQYPVIILKKNN
ncbi:class I SAM-dependent methyltransferase [Planktomarina temperata]|nr:class I SAM-dependent methyltransferase [Planktomarina temperata]